MFGEIAATEKSAFGELRCRIVCHDENPYWAGHVTWAESRRGRLRRKKASSRQKISSFPLGDFILVRARQK